MQGMRFLLVNETGPYGHGIITQEISSEKYLCTFLRHPQVSRVVDVTEIQQWNLFPNDAAMNTFIGVLNKEMNPSPPTDAPPKDNSDKKPPAIKASKKKTNEKK